MFGGAIVGFYGELAEFRSVRYLRLNEETGRVKERILDVPNKPMRLMHSCLVALLRDFPASPYSVGCRTGDSPRRAIQRHRGNRYIYRVDIRDAYGATQVQRLARVLASLFEVGEEEVLAFVRQYCWTERGLPQGAPASPELFNLYCRGMDLRIGEVCGREGLVYTRYLDDLIMSGARPISRRVRREIQACLRESGFTTHPRKTKIWDLLIGGPVTLLGIRLSSEGRMSVPLRLVRKALNHLREARCCTNRVEGLAGIVRSLPDVVRSPSGEERQLLSLYSRLRLARRSRSW